MTINKRLITSGLTIAAASSVLVGAAFAFFSDKVDVDGVTLSTSSADLRLNGQDSLAAPALFAGPAYPGWVDGQAFSLENVSAGDFDLSITAQIVNATGDWNELKDVVQIAVIEYSSAAAASADVASGTPGGASLAAIVANTGWQTLATFNASPISIGTPLTTSGVDPRFVLWGQIPTTAGNEIADKTVSLDFDIVGTQIAP